MQYDQGFEQKDRLYGRPGGRPVGRTTGLGRKKVQPGAPEPVPQGTGAPGQKLPGTSGFFAGGAPTGQQPTTDTGVGGYTPVGQPPTSGVPEGGGQGMRPSWIGGQGTPPPGGGPGSPFGQPQAPGSMPQKQIAPPGVGPMTPWTPQLGGGQMQPTITGQVEQSATGGVGTSGEFTRQVQQPTTPTGSGIAPANVTQTPYSGFLQGLTQPIRDPYQSQFKERANLLREATQGAYGTAAEGLREKMGGRGLRVGESGMADTAVGRIQEAGAQELTRGYRGLASEEAQRQQEMGLATSGLNLQRQLGGGQMALAGEEGALDRMMRYYQSQMGAEQAQWQPYWQKLQQGWS